MKNLVHFKKSAEYKLFRAGGELYKRRSPSKNIQVKKLAILLFLNTKWSFRSLWTNIQELMKSEQFYRFSSLKNMKWLTLKLFTNEGQLILNFNLSRPKIYFPAKKNWFCYDAKAIICRFQLRCHRQSFAPTYTIPNLRNPGKEAGDNTKIELETCRHAPNTSPRHPSAGRCIQERRDRKDFPTKRYINI